MKPFKKFIMLIMLIISLDYCLTMFKLTIIRKRKLNLEFKPIKPFGAVVNANGFQFVFDSKENFKVLNKLGKFSIGSQEHWK
jgi:phosphotransferase system IIB component